MFISSVINSSIRSFLKKMYWSNMFFTLDMCYWQLAIAKWNICQVKADGCNVIKILLLPTDTPANSLTLGSNAHARLLPSDRLARARNSEVSLLAGYQQLDVDVFRYFSGAAAASDNRWKSVCVSRLSTKYFNASTNGWAGNVWVHISY